MYSTREISPDAMQKPARNKGKHTERQCTEISGSAWERNWVVGLQILTACVNDTVPQKYPHHGVIGTLLRTSKRFQDLIHHQSLVPELVVKCYPRNPVVVPLFMHHHQVHPLWKTPLDSSRRI